MDKIIQIPNGTHQVIVQLPNITNQINIPPPDITTFFLPLALVLATFGLVGVTWYWNWRTHNVTQYSNKILSQELRASMIPLLQFRRPRAMIFNLPQLFNPTIPTRTLRIGMIYRIMVKFLLVT